MSKNAELPQLGKRERGVYFSKTLLNMNRDFRVICSDGVRRIIQMSARKFQGNDNNKPIYCINIEDVARTNSSDIIIQKEIVAEFENISKSMLEVGAMQFLPQAELDDFYETANTSKIVEGVVAKVQARKLDETEILKNQIVKASKEGMQKIAEQLGITFDESTGFIQMQSAVSEKVDELIKKLKDSTPVDLDLGDREESVALYEKLFNEKPGPNWKLDTINKKIEAKKIELDAQPTVVGDPIESKVE